MKKILFILLIPLPLFCNPRSPDVLVGSAAFRMPQEGTLRIEVSDHTIISWDSFSIGAGETTHFLQPSSHSAVLNRVSGGDPSTILGTLQANGQVYLINPNGLFVGKEAIIDTTSFIASAFNLPDEEFLAGGNLHFSGDSTAILTNCGTILAKDGSAVLIGYKIDNQGSISGQNTILAATKEVVLTQTTNQLLSVHIPVSETDAVQTIAREIEENGNFLSLAIQITDRENASELVEQGGRLLLTGMVFQTGEIEAETLAIQGEKILSAGPLTAARAISIDVGANYIETTAAKLTAPAISIQVEGRLFTSGNYFSEGGSVSLFGDDIVLAGAQIDASGTSGGKIFIEGSTSLEITGPSSIKADAFLTGDGGKIILLSDGTTRFSAIASAQGGVEKGDGGFIEISGENLYCSGSPSVRAFHGAPGTILLDPFDIAIDVVDPGGGFPYFDLINPNTSGNTGFPFGDFAVPLTNGNVVVISPGDDTVASGAGAVYLYNGLTGVLISALYGTSINDQIGVNGAAALNNGNFVIASPSWTNLTGAATWGNGTTGISGQISEMNSLVGSMPNDEISNNGIFPLSNGNYVVASGGWNGAMGAATWGDGTIGITGQISAANSLVGTMSIDGVGVSGVVVLTNGNYVVLSPNWNNGATVHVGAATWGDGGSGINGPVTTTNSLIGTLASDNVGAGAIPLTNGNYVVLSFVWNVGIGAATWGDGGSGITGIVAGPLGAQPNSIVGSTGGDNVGASAIALTNGNYVVLSPNWTGGIGAATWADGSATTSITVSGGNSLTGSTAGDNVGTSGIALANNNYVVLSPNWTDTMGMDVPVGAATWGDGVGGTTVGPVTESNSLYGFTSGDGIGTSAIALINSTNDVNGYYVVLSPTWTDTLGMDVPVGAATWCIGTAPTSMVVSESNSLYGFTSGDQIGLGAIALTNGNYVVLSPFWTDSLSGLAFVGAATWGNGSTGITGPVAESNSLYGAMADDVISGPRSTSFSIPLSNGNYVVISPNWNSSQGAATWGNGTTGIIGPVTTDNSVVGLSSPSVLTMAVDNPNTPPATFLLPFNSDNVSGRVAVSLDDPTLVPFEFGAPQNVTISPGFVAEILNAGSSLTLEALHDINFNSPISVTPPGTGGLTGYAKNNININADIVTTGGPLNLTLIANQNILSTTPFTVNTGSGNIVFVVDNANPTPPEIGTGLVNIPQATLISSGTVQIFTALQSLNTLPPMIDGASFIPGPEFVDTRTERWGVYFPNSFGGIPFTIFYKNNQLFVSPTVPVKSYVHFLTQISNTDNSWEDVDVDWITFIWNLFHPDLELVLKRR